MNNKTKTALLAVPALAALGVGAEAKNNKPNIVFLLFDDLGYADLGCYGQEKIETPNMDALAEHGIRFTDMYSTAPLSSPSRCGLLTGCHSGHAQIRANDELESRGNVWDHAAMLADPSLEGQYPLEAGTPTLGSVLKTAGYKTAMVGKWGVGYPGSDGTPNKLGFDYYFGYICQRQAHTYYPPFLWENDHRVYLDNELLPLGTPLDEGADPMDIRSYDKYTQKEYSPDVCFDRMLNFIDENAKKPFFVMWTTTVPHSAVQAPADEVMYYVNKLGDEKPTKGEGYFPNRYPHATYAAMVTHIDTQVGKLVEELKRLGVYENTIIIVTSDNGPACNSNSPMEYFESAKPFKCSKGWGKSSLHEGGVRMPFIVSWAGHLEKTVSDRVGSFTDVMPTLADVAGVKAKKVPQNDGISFSPMLKGKTAEGHEWLYWEFPGSKGWVGVRLGNWKGLLKQVKKGNDKFELYDLSTDPRESKNVAAEHPEIIEQMWKIAYGQHTVPANPKFRLDIKFPDSVKE